MDLAFESEDAVKTIVVEINLSNGQTYSVCNELEASLVSRKYKGDRIRIDNLNRGYEPSCDPVYVKIERYDEGGSSTVAVFSLSKIVSMSIHCIPLQRRDLSREVQQSLREVIGEWWNEHKTSPSHEDEGGDTIGINTKKVEL